MQLCLRLGKTRAELGRDMTLREFMQWVAWDTVDPIGDERCHDLPGAMQRQVAMAAAGMKNVPKIEELLPFRDRSSMPTVDDFLKGLAPPAPIEPPKE